MSDEVKLDTPAEIPATVPAPGVDSLLARREAIYAAYDKQMQGSAEPDTSAPSTDSGQKESDSSEADVKEPHSESSSVKEEKLVETKKDAEKDSVVPKAALDEERSRRKQATLKLREIQTQYEEKLKSFERQLEEMKNKASDEAYEPKDETRRELEALKGRLAADDSRRAQEAQVKAQSDLENKIIEVDKKLTEKGYPGFELATAKIQKAMVKRFNDGDLEREHLDDPKVWETVFVEDVFPELSSRFGLMKKSQTLEEKKARKAGAGLVSDPGRAPEKKEEKKEELSLDDYNNRYVAERQAATRKLRS